MERALDSCQGQVTGSSGIRMEWRITENPHLSRFSWGQAPEAHRLVRVFGGFLISDVVSARCQAARSRSGAGG